MDAERLPRPVDGVLFGVDQLQPYEPVMPLRPRDEVGNAVEGRVGGGVDRRIHDEDLRRLGLIGLDARGVGLRCPNRGHARWYGAFRTLV